jgi:hypothetical protein
VVLDMARYCIDVDAVLCSGRNTSDELLALDKSHDPGFDKTEGCGWCATPSRPIHQPPVDRSDPATTSYEPPVHGSFD